MKIRIKYLLIILLIKILLSIIIRIINFQRKLKDDDDFNYIFYNKTTYPEEKFDSYKEAFNKAKNFIQNNLEGKLINTKNIKLSKEPEISVVIPCYNCKKYILRALKSIQGQNFSNFEIIIVDDGSKFDTKIFIKQFQKEENRIRIIHNKKNMGLLYTRCIGSLSANGKYIFPIDSDDMILDKDVFYTLITIAMKGDFDIIIYNSITTSLEPDINTTEFAPTDFDKKHQPNCVLFQPDLGYYHIAPSYNLEKFYLNDELIHGKFFKTNVYKLALNKLGKERYSRYLILAEDDIVNNCIFNIAKNAKFLAKYGYLFINNNNSFSKLQNDKVQRARDYLYLLDPLIDFSLNLPRNKKVLVNFIIFLLKNEYLKDLLNKNEYDNKLFISCLDRIFNCKYISDKYKNEIRKRCKMLRFIKYKF